MPQIVNYHNILDPLSREVKLTSARNRFEVLADLQYDAIAYDVKIYLNNNLQLDDFEVKENELCVIVDWTVYSISSRCWYRAGC